MPARALKIAVPVFLAAVSCAAPQQYDSSLAQTLAYISAAAYCNSSSIENWDCSHCRNVTGISRATTVNATAYDSPVQAYVAQFSSGGIVVSYRGTESNDGIAPWIVDLAFFFKNASFPGCDGCELHEGFFAGYRALQPGVAIALSAYNAMHAPFVHVTGHSLGAAMAEIAAFELVAAGVYYGKVT